MVVQATGVTTGRWRRVFAGAVNVKWFGARGNAWCVTGGSITAGSTTLTVTGAAFLTGTAEVGKLIIIPGAGVGGIDYQTTIVSRTSATVVEVALAASTTVSAQPITYGTDDAAAISAAMDFAVSQATSKTAINTSSANSSSGTPFQTNGPAVYLPSGIYTCSNGWTRTGGAKVFKIYGDGKASTRIDMCGVNNYFLTVNDIIRAEIHDFTLMGGKGLLGSTLTGASVFRGMMIVRMGITRFTECGIGHGGTDWPLWRIEDCDFQAIPTTNTSIAIALSGLSDETIVANNTFVYCKYGIKLGRGGNNAKIFNNFLTRAIAGGAGIWIVPNSVATNAGQGLEINSNKHASELSVAGSYHILVADEAAGTTFKDKQHATTLSAGIWSGAKICNPLVNGASGAAPPLIYSYTPKISGLQIVAPHFYGSMPANIVEMDPLVTAAVGTGDNKANIITAPSADVLLSQVVTSFRACNVPGIFQVHDPLCMLSGGLDYRSQYGVGYPADYLDITSMLGGALTAGGSAVSAFTNPTGQAGGEWIFVDGTTGLIGGNVNATIVDGRLGWCEIELQQGATQSLAEVVVSIRRAETVAECSHPIRLTANLVRYVFPFVVPTKGAQTIRIKVAPVGWVTGVTDTARVGAIRLYYGAHPIPAGHLAATGSNAGAYNGPHLVLGAYHLWVSSGGKLYVKSGAPTTDTDGTIVGTQT